MTHLVAYKSNVLIEASYKLTLQEQRFLLVCIGRLNSKEENSEKIFTITAAEFYLNFPDMGKQHAEEKLKEAVDRLWDRSIIIKDKNVRKEFRWIQYRAQYLTGEGKAQIMFSNAIIPYLTQLKGQFTRVIVRNISSLASAHSIRIYELLQQFRSTGDRMIRVDDFRSMLGIDKKYPLFKDFNKLLIKIAIKELNEKTDLMVKVDPVKQGRKVVALHFQFQQKKKKLSG